MKLSTGLFYWTLRTCFFAALLYASALGTDKAYVNNYLGIYELALWVCAPIYLIAVIACSVQYANLDSKKEGYAPEFRRKMEQFEKGYKFSKSWVSKLLYSFIYKCVYGPSTIVMAGIFLGDYSLFFITLFIYATSLVYMGSVRHGFRMLHKLENKDNPQYDEKKDEVVEEPEKDPEENLRFQSLEIT